MKNDYYTILDKVKLFGISNQLIEADLDIIERDYNIDLGRSHESSIEKDQDYYPQIDRAFRFEAASMSKHYEIFYSLEKSIRAFVSDSITDVENGDWWNSDRIPKVVKDGVKKRISDERDTGVTPRSDEPLDFTTFGELAIIISANRDIFGSVFPSSKAVERVLSNLNTLRGPIAHCSPLAEDEIVRLQLSVRDWFRLME